MDHVCKFYPVIIYIEDILFNKMSYPAGMRNSITFLNHIAVLSAENMIADVTACRIIVIC